MTSRVEEPEERAEPQLHEAIPATAPAVAAERLDVATPDSIDEAVSGAEPRIAPADQLLETYLLHPAAVRVRAWMQGLVLLTLLLPASVIGTVLWGPLALLAGVLAGVLAWRVAARYLRSAVERFRCERFTRGLRYRHGVWWQSETFIPSARVQHTEVNQGPIARRFGLGTLKVFTAAVQLGALEIDGLAYSDALLLRDRLLSRDIDLTGVASRDVQQVEAHAERDSAPGVDPRDARDAAAHDV